MTQDEQGFIWVLNDYKLHRFDGRNFVVYTPPTDISGSTNKLHYLNSYNDSLLVLLSSSHLYLFEPNTGEWQAFPKPVQKGRKSSISGAHPLKKGNLGIYLYSENSDTLNVYVFNGQQFEKHLHKDVTLTFDKKPLLLPNGELLLYQYSIEQYTVDKAGQKSVLQTDSLGLESFMNISPAASGDLFVLGNSPNLQKVFNWKPQTDTFTPHPVNRFLSQSNLYLSAVLSVEDGSLWLCGPDRNLAYYNADIDTLFDFTTTLRALLPNVNDIIYPYIDKTGTVWLMTRLGLLKVTLHKKAFGQYLSNSETECNGFCSIRGITESPEGDVFASYYHGIARIDPTQKGVKAFYSHRDHFIPLPSGLYADEHGLWLNNGNLMIPETGMIRKIPGAKDVIWEEGLFSKGKEGPLWWVIDHELFYLDTTKGELKWEKVLELPHKGGYITEAIQAGQQSGNLFISHKGKLLLYEPDTRKQKWFSFKGKDFSVTRILAIEEIKPGLLWLATDVGLLSLQLENEEVKRYTVEDGLSNNYICGMLSEGDSALWLSTNHGLSRFHIGSESFINFFEQDGLSHNEFNRKSFYKAKDGQMYFGGLQGINAFYPEELLRSQQRRNQAAEVFLTEFEYTDERKNATVQRFEFAEQPTIDIRYWHRSFAFKYTLSDYLNPEEVAYSYRMEGYEDSWSQPSKFNFTRFSSLPAGQYTFRVKARDSHGLWHPNQLAVNVVVHAPWWATWWAYLLYVSLIAALIYYFWRSSLRQQALKNNLMLEKIEADKFKELDSFKSRFYTSLTHEFRTPLTVILGMAEQIKKAPDKHLASGVELIRNNGNNLLKLINQQLDLSKLESGMFQLRLLQGDIVPYLRYLSESFQTYANSQNLSLRFHATVESVVMDYDPEQLKQIVTNLISNAIKFTPSGGEVVVRTKQENKQLLLQVSDTGVGIDEEKLPFVFDRFYQAENFKIGQENSTGIGLAHTQELVKLMGGTIGVESKPGKGARFTVTLPINNQAQSIESNIIPQQEGYQSGEAITESTVQSSTEHAAPSTKVPVSATGGRPQLLIVEDNPDVVTYLKSCLNGIYQVDVAYNGLIGIEKATENIPDLIISDVMMPEKNGYELCDTLKNDERTSHIPIILLTAKADASSRITGLRRGADVYLAKPFNSEELLVRLDKLVERQKRMVAYFSAKSPTPEVKEAEIQIEDEFIKKVRKIIEQHYQDEDFALPQLCHKISMSRSQLYRKLKALTGQSPSDFIRSYRLQKAKALLETSDMNVSEVAWEVGYKDVAHFSRSYQEVFGFSPSATNK